jgi:hypothetical protein
VLVVSPLEPSFLTDSIYGLSCIIFNGAILITGVNMFFFDLIFRTFFYGSDLHVTLPGGQREPLGTAAARIIKELGGGARVLGSGGIHDRFNADPAALVTGETKDAALGVNHYMRADDSHVYRCMGEGVAAVVREFEASGTEEDRECLDYVLNQRAGSSDKTFQSGLTRDIGRSGETLQDFAEHPSSRTAKLSLAHVLCLRLYTTAAYKSLNNLLRDSSADRPPHPFPVTINFIRDGISKLRAVDAEREKQVGCANSQVDLWRGMRNMKVDAGFARQGGTELALMSTTTDLRVAMEYGRSAASLLFKLRTDSCMQRGADLNYLSAFPGESEILFPPLTYLLPTGKTMTLPFTEAGVQFEVVEVVPIMP